MKENLKVGMGIVCILVMAMAVLWVILAYAYVDVTQARFEQGEIVQCKIGGIGQIVHRTGTNEGMPWDLTPVFHYKVRRADGQIILYCEWELFNV